MVKAYVADGVLTDNEKADLESLAEQEDINKQEANLYITSELKKRKAKLKNPKSWVDNATKIGGTVASIAGVAITIIGKFTKK